MTISWRPGVIVIVVVVVALAFSGVGVRGQQPVSRSASGSGPTLAAWTATVDAMLRDGRLDIGNVQRDPMIPGRTHERLGQRYEGLPVFGGELVRQMDGRRIVSVFGRIFENVSLPTIEPSIDAASAAAIAEASAGDAAVARAPELGVLAQADGCLLVYRMEVRSPRDIQTYDVNARTGVIETHFSRIQSQTAIVGRGTGVLGDQKKMSAAQASGGFQALDLLRPATAVTLDFHGSAARLTSFLLTGVALPSDTATSTANTWTDGAIVDAHVYQAQVYDYYFRRFGRLGLDDHNIRITGVVHPLARADAALYSPTTVGTFINNALYLGSGFMLYGDGDGRALDFLAGALDVVGHELTHGVTEFTSNLEYRNESGALNEAFSDIMGTAIEFFYEKSGRGPQRGPNFLVGEDVTRASPGYIRSLDNPNAAGDPDHYSLRRFIGTSTDNGGVHFNSTIVGHTFYLAVVGGRNRVSGITVQGVGLSNMERMERVFYRAFAFLMGPLSQFSDARAATLQAASELYGANSNERAQVLQAWTAVGVP